MSVDGARNGNEMTWHPLSLYKICEASDKAKRELPQSYLGVSLCTPGCQCSANGSYLQFYLPDDIIEVAKPPVYKCKQVRQVDTVITKDHLLNGTLSMPCYSSPEQCTKYECALGAFDSNLKSQNYALDLQFIPSRIKLNYERLLFQLRLELYVDGIFLKRTEAYDAIDLDITFERQASRLSKSSPLIMICGGGGIGLLILLITNGLFKRKKRDQLLQVKQRMSMNPNLFPNSITGLERDENDD
ncbi:hypothetical protein TYRP_003112 [Tyrophagus putrescentiae]|nr:hypothetical protein TYRP_003112 [Tyrophagus putrescentiae]